MATITNTRFDMDKTKELIEGLKCDGVHIGIENIDSYIKKQGLIVKEHVGGGKSSYSISPQIYGLDIDGISADTSTFITQHTKNGKVSFLPYDKEKQFKAIEAKLRKRKRELSIGYDDSFLPIASYLEFKTYFEECKREYLELRDEVVSNYNPYLARFKEVVKSTLIEFKAFRAEAELDSVIAKIPSRINFHNSFYMNLSVKAFPVIDNLDMFDESIANDILNGVNEDAISMIYESIGSTLNDAFTALVSVVNTKNEVRLHQKVTMGIKNSVLRMGQKNIFGNAKLDAIKSDIESILNVDLDEGIEIAEATMAEIFMYAKELSILANLDISKGPFTGKELEEIYELYQ